MKSNARELAIEVTGWMVYKGVPPDNDGLQLGAAVGNFLQELMQFRNNMPSKIGHGELKRRKFIHETHLRRIAATAIIGVLHYCHLKGAYLSFDEARSYVKGVEHEKFTMLLAFLFQNCCTIYKDQVQAPVHMTDEEKEEQGSEVFYRVGGQRYLNTIFAIIANLNLGDPIKDVIEPVWSQYVA